MKAECKTSVEDIEDREETSKETSQSALIVNIEAGESCISSFLLSLFQFSCSPIVIFLSLSLKALPRFSGSSVSFPHPPPVFVDFLLPFSNPLSHFVPFSFRLLLFCSFSLSSYFSPAFLSSLSFNFIFLSLAKALSFRRVDGLQHSRLLPLLLSSEFVSVGQFYPPLSRIRPTCTASSRSDSDDRHNFVLRNAWRESLQGRQLHQRW